MNQLSDSTPLESIGFYSLSDERARNASPTSQMKRCELIITEYCNFRCAYCRGLNEGIYQNRAIKELTLTEIKRVIDLWCVDGPLENIRFSGGEPTLHGDIKEIVSYARERGVKRIAISTNGSNDLCLYEELIRLGVNDYSISLDACCSEDGDKMSGGIKHSWEKVVANIRALSMLTYVTVGIVLTPENVSRTVDTVLLAHSLGVSDIRIISAAQYNEPIEELGKIPQDVRRRYPILDYRVKNSIVGRNVRGLRHGNSGRCALVLDDSVIAGDCHFPCVIYMRERGYAIGKVGECMRQERFEWFKRHNSFEDRICRENCLDVCIHYNNRWASEIANAR